MNRPYFNAYASSARVPLDLHLVDRPGWLRHSQADMGVGCKNYVALGGFACVSRFFLTPPDAAQASSSASDASRSSSQSGPAFS
jgi:hypothetical protein